jgi:hypothetical protein
MCWKQEWAMAINNLERAIEHVAKAETKLHIRHARNKMALYHLSASKKHCGPASLAPVEALKEKNRLGIEECERVIADLRSRQDQLFGMINVYGIRLSENPKRVYALMGNYHVPNVVFEGTRMIFQKKEAES